MGLGIVDAMVIIESDTLCLFCKQRATAVGLRRRVHFNTPKHNRYTYYVLYCEKIAKTIVFFYINYTCTMIE